MQGVTSVNQSATGVREFMKLRGFEPCTGETVSEARAIATRLIQAELATLETIRAVHARTGESTVYVRREHGMVRGFLAFFGMSEEGEAAMDAGRFDTRNVDPAWVAPPSPDLRSGYVWGFAGDTRGACFAVIRTGRDMRDRFFPHLRVFARAATSDGRKVMEPMGYIPVSPADPSLYFSPPFSLTNLRGGA